MRYAEILLMAAETANELQGPAAALPYLREIRERAFNAADWTEKVDNYLSTLGTKEAMFAAIVDEHKFEFTGEMERKQALIRWNLLSTKINEAKTKMYALIDRTGEYADVPSILHYRYAADNESLEIYGLNRGENDPAPAGYDSNFAWTNLTPEKVESIYIQNPDSRQFWPIWQVFLSSSNGQLLNDYGY